MVKMVSFTQSPMVLPLLFLSTILAVHASSLFTPAAMLSVTRRGTAIPNSKGTLALYTTSTYNFTTHAHKYGLWVIDLATSSSTLLSNSSAIGEATWFGDGNELLWTVGEDDGPISFVVGDATKADMLSSLPFQCPDELILMDAGNLTLYLHSPIDAGSVPGSVSGLKLVALGNSPMAMVYSGTAAPNGTLYNSELAKTPISTGRMYTKVFVRHWDTCKST
jgi:hypothetical protein